jgi:hypothetical protein
VIDDPAKLAQVRSDLARWMLGAPAFAALLVLLVFLLMGRADWLPSLGAAFASVMLALLATLPVLGWALRQPPHTAAMLILGTGGLRLVLAGGACVLAVVVGKFLPTPVFVGLIPLYLAVLIAEVVVLYRALWKGAT